MSEFNLLTQETTTVGVATVLGGLVLKFAENFVSNKSVLEDHTTLRKELREELDAVKLDLKRIQDEVDEWREKYYSQVETTNELLYEVGVLKGRLAKYESFTGEHRYTDD
jgi:hypothetical protein